MKTNSPFWVGNRSSTVTLTNRPYCQNLYTGEPHYIREMGNPKIDWHITNLNIKRPRITVNLRIGSWKMAIFQLYLRKIADEKASYNKGCLYLILLIFLVMFGIVFDSHSNFLWRLFNSRYSTSNTTRWCTIYRYCLFFTK